MFTKVILFAVYELAGLVAAIIGSMALFYKSVNRFGSDTETLKRIRNVLNRDRPKGIKAAKNAFVYCMMWPIVLWTRSIRQWEIIVSELEETGEE